MNMLHVRRSPERRSREQAYERTHHAILEATIDVIARHGLSATTIQQVAEAAKVAPGTVILHFKTKEGLLEAILEAVAAEFEAARDALIKETSNDPVRYLLRLMEITLDRKISSPKRIAVWYAFWGEAGARKVYMKRVGHVDRDHDSHIIDMCRLLTESGDYPHIDPVAAAMAYSGLLEWHWLELLVSKSNFDFDLARKRIRGYLTSVFPKHF